MRDCISYTRVNRKKGLFQRFYGLIEYSDSITLVEKKYNNRAFQILAGNILVPSMWNRFSCCSDFAISIVLGN